MITSSNESKRHSSERFRSGFFIPRPRHRPSVPLNDNWAGRVTVPEPFPLTNSMSVDNIHRRKCMHEMEAAKIQKEVDDELLLTRSFKGSCSVLMSS
jgi:hypothetical protein